MHISSALALPHLNTNASHTHQEGAKRQADFAGLDQSASTGHTSPMSFMSYIDKVKNIVLTCEQESHIPSFRDMCQDDKNSQW